MIRHVLYYVNDNFSHLFALLKGYIVDLLSHFHPYTYLEHIFLKEFTQIY